MINQKKLSCFILLLFTAVIAPLPAYSADNTELPTGSLELTGSIALTDLVSEWIDGFRQRYPGIEVTLADAGSEAGITALINGSEDAVVLGMPLDTRQRSAFENHYGYPPQLFPVAMDGVAVYVNKLNPLKRITLTQLDAIFSITRRCGEALPIKTWGQLGVTGPLKSRRILAYGLIDTSGVYQLFRDIALCSGDFKPDFRAMPGPDALESSIESQTDALGFSSSALHSADIRPVAIARNPDSGATLPDEADIRNRRYPLSRMLVIAVNLPPGRSLPPVLKAFLNYAHSTQGQEVTTKAGYIPL